MYTLPFSFQLVGLQMKKKKAAERVSQSRTHARFYLSTHVRASCLCERVAESAPFCATDRRSAILPTYRQSLFIGPRDDATFSRIYLPVFVYLFICLFVWCLLWYIIMVIKVWIV